MSERLTSKTKLQPSEMGRAEPTTRRASNLESDWYISDEIVQFRVWGTENACRLSMPHRQEQALEPFMLGTGSMCRFRIEDPSGLASREHVALHRVSTDWHLRDISTNGTTIDGARVTECVLRAGAKLQVGGLLLVAESESFIALRSLASRFVGWDPPRVDATVQGLRNHAIHRVPLVLLGDEDLLPVAVRLNRAIRGPSAPFLLWDGVSPFNAPPFGTLCVSTRVLRLRGKDDKRIQALHDALRKEHLRLIICARNEDELALLAARLEHVALIRIPPLARRHNEMDQLVIEYSNDIAHELGASFPGYTQHDMKRLRAIRYYGYADLEKTLQRLITVRTWGMKEAASRFGRSYTSLWLWMHHKKRRLSTGR